MEAPEATKYENPVVDEASETIAAITAAQAISADEIALYDRQIRLWGVQAQENIRKADILLIRIKALANEVAKNLVLAGIGSLTIIDEEKVTEEDLAAQFFVSEADIGKNRAEAVAPEIQKLNPRVKLHVDSSDIRTKPDLAAFLSPFDVIIACDLDFPTTSTLNAASRLHKKPFYSASSHGMYGCIFADLIDHDFVIERKKANVATKIGPENTTRRIISASTKRKNGEVREIVTKRELYSPLVLANTSPLPSDILKNRRRLRQVSPLLPCLRALWDFEKQQMRLPTHTHPDLLAFTTLATEKHKELQLPTESLKAEFLRSFVQNIASEVAPVTAWLGGQLAQDVINVLGKRQQPIQNLVLFDGEDFTAPIYSLHPFFDDGLDGVVNGTSNVGAGLATVNGSSAGVMVID
ncbi:hypothetical protein EJ08DRAFT_612555 [Tothia fuscella]|uniref:Ubiquitin-like 1-activating enzyme E1A n=1 Tax=Tothia fuscella TaxID=1048955 RepID=A0A9P4NQZ1_9PEZI|nr:hypothetical protein EJ08DRAFT_612555 [Tothia fuscella]